MTPAATFNQRIRLSLDSLPVSVTISNSNAQLVHATPSAKALLKLFGGPSFDTDQFYGNKLSTLFKESTHVSQFDQAVSTGQAIDMQVNGHQLRLLARDSDSVALLPTVVVQDELRSLVRVSRIEDPDAALLNPEQSFFLRENLKLRLLNARLALLSRQFDTAQRDLQVVQTALDRYFEHNSRRTALATDLVRQVATMARQVAMPKPDDTLVALAAASAGR